MSSSSARTDSSRSSTGVSSSLVWLRPRRLLTKSITVGMTRAISAASCSGPLGSRCEVPATSSITASAMSMSAVERDRLDLPDALPLTSQPSSAAIRSLRLLRLGEHVGEHVGVERALVERQLADAVERRDDPGATFTIPVVARTSSRPPRVVIAPGQRAARGGQEGVAAHLHRRRAGVGVHAGEAHRVALDAEGAQHGAQRLVDRLEHRALLDVQLEVGGRALELARASSAESRSTPCSRGRRAAPCRRGR